MTRCHLFLTNLASAQTLETNTIDRLVTMGLMSALSVVRAGGNCAKCVFRPRPIIAETMVSTPSSVSKRDLKPVRSLVAQTPDKLAREEVGEIEIIHFCLCPHKEAGASLTSWLKIEF